jgi:hypothetical protein
VSSFFGHEPAEERPPATLAIWLTQPNDATYDDDDVLNAPPHVVA